MGTPLKILAVDDDEINLVVLQEMLCDYPCQLITCDGGEAALNALRGPDPIDVLLLDLMMPGVDGWQVLSFVRGHPGRARLPVIILSARAEASAIAAGLAAGADEYLTKPFGPEQLISALDRQVARGE